MMTDVERGAHLLEARLSVRVERMAHRKNECVIGQHRFDAVRKGRDDVFQEGGRGRARLVGVNRDDGLPAKVIDGRKLEVMPRVTERRQVFQIEMEQLAGSLLFVSARLGPRGPWQLIRTVALEDALNRTVPNAQDVRDPDGTQALPAQPQDVTLHRPGYAAGRSVRTTAVWQEGREVPGLVTRPPAAEHLARNAEVRTQDRQGNALLMHRHQLGSKYGVISHTTHASPPRRIL
jgi:hypothetical protein